MEHARAMKRIIVILLVTALFFCTFSPHHDCGSSDCALCALLSQQKSAVCAMLCLFSAALMLLHRYMLLSQTGTDKQIFPTLVSLHIRLSI